MSTERKYWKYSLIVLILGIGIIILSHLMPFLGGLLGALTVYILVRKQMFYLTEKRHIKQSLAAIIITTEATLCFLVPIALGGWFTISNILDIHLNPQDVIASITNIANTIKQKTGYNILGEDAMNMIISTIPQIGQAIMNGVSSFFINIIVLIFVLYFMLVGGRSMEQYVCSILPFNASDKQTVLTEIKVLIRSNTIGIPLLAIIQSLLAVLGYWLFDAPDILLLGVLTCVASLLPVIGTALIWAPVSLYLYFTGEIWQSIALAVYGIIVISQSDNLIRLVIQKQMADTHPLITIFGVVIGLPIFGFMGIIFGPLLLSMFLLLADMFRKKYLHIAARQMPITP